MGALPSKCSESQENQGPITTAVALGSLILLGIGFACWKWIPPLEFLRPITRIGPDSWGRLLAVLAWTMGIANLCIHVIMRLLDRAIGVRDQEKLRKGLVWPPVIIGCCESLIYPVAFLLNAREFIGAWLLIKATGGWKLWTEDAEGRARYYQFLIGSVLSVLLSGIGGYMAIRVLVLSPNP